MVHFTAHSSTFCGQGETLVVDSMHERKMEMAKRVRGFFGLPGGYGTFEEVCSLTSSLYYLNLRILMSCS